MRLWVFEVAQLLPKKHLWPFIHERKHSPLNSAKLAQRKLLWSYKHSAKRNICANLYFGLTSFCIVDEWKCGSECSLGVSPNVPRCQMTYNTSSETICMTICKCEWSQHFSLTRTPNPCSARLLPGHWHGAEQSEQSPAEVNHLNRHR